MSKAIKYLEQVATIDESELGDTFETVSINEAIIACELQEQETLTKFYAEFLPFIPEEKAISILHKIEELNKKLKNIKIK